MVKKKTIKTWVVDVNNIVTSELIERENNSKYFIGYLNDAIRPLVLILPKLSEYLRTFNDKDRHTDKNKNDKLISFHIYDIKLLEKYKTIWTKIEDLQNVGLNALPFHIRYINTKLRTYGDNIYTNFCSLNVPEHVVECELFTVIFIDYLFVYKNKYYLQVYLDN